MALAVADLTLTLLGQPAEYWAGAFESFQERSPFAGLLARHPLWFLAGAFAWWCIFSAVILTAGRRPAMVLSLAVVIGHGWGVAAWTLRGYRYGYWYAIALCLLSAVVVSLAWEKNRPELYAKPSRKAWTLTYAIVCAAGAAEAILVTALRHFYSG
jgi:hypothetical protein